MPISLSPTTPKKKLKRKVRKIEIAIGTQKKAERQNGVGDAAGGRGEMVSSSAVPALPVEGAEVGFILDRL